jgi:hypothetical protein
MKPCFSTRYRSTLRLPEEGVPTMAMNMAECRGVVVSLIFPGLPDSDHQRLRV